MMWKVPINSPASEIWHGYPDVSVSQLPVLSVTTSYFLLKFFIHLGIDKD